ncbi:MAG TPA: hypothetical protein VIE12_12675, partial [Actinomycetota bacterium]
SRTGRAAALAALGVACLSIVGFGLGGEATAATSASPVLIVEIDATALPELIASPPVRALVGAGDGGASLLVAATPGDPLAQLTDALGSEGRPPAIVTMRAASTERLTAVIEPALLAVTHGPLTELPIEQGTLVVMLVTTPPPADPERLGAAAVVVGSAGSMLDALERGDGPPIERTLTSDSTRRAGVVTSADVATTAIDASDVPVVGDPDGSTIDVVDAPPPVGLYERYLDQRRLAVPVGIVTGLYAFAAGLLGLILVLARAGSPRVRTFAAWAAIAVVPITAGLMLVGHLDRLTYASVFAFLAAVAAVAVLAMALVRRDAGSLAAIAALGAGLLVVFAVEAALGWTATLTPLLGGAQLDGGRFFGLPNVQIGLLMGASLYVAQRLPSTGAGVVLILAAALFAGLPWTGSNIGAAVTIAAAAGIWWGLRADEGRLRPGTILRVLATVAGTVALVVVAHRYLTDVPTHISRFASDTGGVVGLWDKFVDRLGVGADLIARNPFGLIPILGILATLWLVLRPPSGLRSSLSAHPAWRDALVTILLGSVIAYVANDSGAAAIGLGFGTALGGLLYVSLTDAPAKMEAA